MSMDSYIDDEGKKKCIIENTAMPLVPVHVDIVTEGTISSVETAHDNDTHADVSHAAMYVYW